MITKTIIWKRDDGGLSLTYYDDRDDYDTVIAKHVKGTVSQIIDGVAEVPDSREHRECWDFSNGKVEVAQDKLQVKLDAIAASEAKKQAILGKLNISEADLDHILEG